MACKFICDGCGKEIDGVFYNHDWHKPASWYERSEKHDSGVQTACSRECIEKIAEKTGKTNVVLPF